MSTLTPQDPVAAGFYYGFTSAEITAEKALYVAAVKAFTTARRGAAGGVITLVSMGGKSIQYDQAGAQRMLDEWRRHLKDAEAQIAGEYSPHADRAVMRFR